ETANRPQAPDPRPARPPRHPHRQRPALRRAKTHRPPDARLHPAGTAPPHHAATHNVGTAHPAGTQGRDGNPGRPDPKIQNPQENPNDEPRIPKALIHAGCGASSDAPDLFQTCEPFGFNLPMNPRKPAQPQKMTDWGP